MTIFAYFVVTNIVVFKYFLEKYDEVTSLLCYTVLVIQRRNGPPCAIRKFIHPACYKNVLLLLLFIFPGK